MQKKRKQPLSDMELRLHLFNQIQITSASYDIFISTIIKPFKLTPPQFKLLNILRGEHPEALTVSSLATSMTDPQSNASRLVEKLASKKLVQRVPDENDKRRVFISLTPIGLELIENAADSVNKRLSEKMENISRNDIEQFIIEVERHNLRK